MLLESISASPSPAWEAQTRVYKWPEQFRICQTVIKKKIEASVLRIFGFLFHFASDPFILLYFTKRYESETD